MLMFAGEDGHSLIMFQICLCMHVSVLNELDLVVRVHVGRALCYLGNLLPGWTFTSIVIVNRKCVLDDAHGKSRHFTHRSRQLTFKLIKRDIEVL